MGGQKSVHLGLNLGQLFVQILGEGLARVGDIQPVLFQLFKHLVRPLVAQSNFLDVGLKLTLKRGIKDILLPALGPLLGAAVIGVG
ncbi:MAG: hypothetical protein A2901_05700 [Elusimicrobia bacterium RIFCSPLOWO2_01_FULL_54_10]|nr:MAG: hypothetical protein A2901_05700 [Elusimicrobia bacterium RIFCSPLOWO2_01_FULL_54_10]